MKSIGLAQQIFLASFLALTTAIQDDCTPWFFPDASKGNGCVCSSIETKGIKCSKDTALLLRMGVCMTYNSETRETEIGPCPYIFQRSKFSSDNLYIRLPKYTSNLTSFMCGPLHRKGALCGNCEDGFGPALYSYQLECKKCWGHGVGWLMYITLTVIPTTVLYIIVVVFHVSVTTPPLNVFVLFCHLTVYIVRLEPDLYYFVDEIGGFTHVLLKVMLAFCGFWNLDFFRPIIHPFCISPNMKSLHAFALEYIEAFYPLTLIVITYICIKMHDHSFRPVVLLWKPFRRCFVYFRRHCDPEGSIINAFATFFLLSFTKILFVSFNLLYAVRPQLVNRNGTQLNSNLVMYYDSTVECFSKEHLPFAVISICVGLVFIAFPTFLLILYPTRVFRKCITCCGFRRWHALHTFMEAFQGQYKDGTNGTRDFRIVSALYLIFRIAVLLEYLCGSHDRGNHAHGWLTTAVALASTSLFFAIVRPYKVIYLNAIDSLLLTFLCIQSLLCLFMIYLPKQRYSHAIGVSALLGVGIPHAVLMLYVLYFILKKLRTLQYLNRKCRCLLGRCFWMQHSLTDFLPDRLVNSDEYKPLIPAVNQQGTENFQSESCTVHDRVTPMNTYGIVD